MPFNGGNTSIEKPVLCRERNISATVVMPFSSYLSTKVGIFTTNPQTLTNYPNTSTNNCRHFPHFSKPFPSLTKCSNSTRTSQNRSPM